MVGPIWRGFAQKTIYFLLKLHRPTYQSVCEKGTKPKEKKLSQLGEPFLRKIPKTTWKNQFPENLLFYAVFGIFLKNSTPDWLNFVTSLQFWAVLHIWLTLHLDKRDVVWHLVWSYLAGRPLQQIPRGRWARWGRSRREQAWSSVLDFFRLLSRETLNHWQVSRESESQLLVGFINPPPPRLFDFSVALNHYWRGLKRAWVLNVSEIPFDREASLIAVYSMYCTWLWQHCMCMTLKARLRIMECKVSAAVWVATWASKEVLRLEQRLTCARTGPQRKTPSTLSLLGGTPKITVSRTPNISVLRTPTVRMTTSKLCKKFTKHAKTWNQFHFRF